MIDVKDIARQAIENKVKKEFPVNDMRHELKRLSDEVKEARQAHLDGSPKFGEELADVFIFLVCSAEFGGIDLEAEVIKKLAINEARVYLPDGVKVK